jgi:hypothetical protein
LQNSFRGTTGNCVERGQLAEPRTLEDVFALDTVARRAAEAVLQRLGE